MSKSLYDQSREVSSHFRQDDFFLLFNQGYLRLNFSLTRLALIRMRSYQNFYVFYQRGAESESAELHEEFVEILDRDNHPVLYDNIETRCRLYLQKAEHLVAFCIRNRKMAMKKE